MRKAIRLGMCLAIIMAMTGTVYADNGVMPCYTYVNIIRATLNINAGTATAYGSIQPIGGLKTSVDVQLQRESSPGSWVTIAIWVGSNNNGKSEAGGTKVLTSGYNYRVYVTGKVYDSNGAVIETVTKHSVIKAY